MSNLDIVKEAVQETMSSCGIPEGSYRFEPREEKRHESTLFLQKDSLYPVCKRLKEQHSFDFLRDVTGVDFPNREKRFDVVYNLYSGPQNVALRIKCELADGEEIDSVESIWRSADWHEREAYDMFGFPFKNHPNLKRILTHHEFVGHPLRKDYDAEHRQPLSTPMEHTYESAMKNHGEEFGEDWMVINVGPAHPATHGTMRLMMVIDGSERIRKCDLEIGYLHRCFEKMCENHNYNQVIPYTDRLNYCSSPMNNNCYASTIEKALGISIPDRAQVVRMILDELSRIIDHFVCVGACLVDLGAITGFFYGMQEREQVYNLFEKLCGARLTVSLTRIGGLGFDLPDGWIEEAKQVVASIRKTHAEVYKLVTTNRIYMNRTQGVGDIDKDTAASYGFTGPCLRATGYEYDVRKADPYYAYNEVDFDIPIGEHGDTYDRYLVRMEEIIQSCRILEWCFDNLPSGPIIVDNKDIALPPKSQVYGNIEGLMNHFMLVINGIKVPPGEIYHRSEAANGELGFYVVSDGTGTPYRVKCRPPCFPIASGFPEMIKGQMEADAVAALGSINFIAGELDR